MLYFAAVSFAEVGQRLSRDDAVAWSGFLGVGDAVLDSLPGESLRRLREITRRRGESGTADERRRFADWVAEVIAPRNIAGLADARRRNLYPVDFDLLVEQHALLGMTRHELLAAVPALRGMSPERPFVRRGFRGPDAAPAPPLGAER